MKFDRKFHVYYKFEEILSMKFIIYKINKKDEITFEQEIQPAEDLFSNQRIAFTQSRPLEMPSSEFIIGETICDLVSLMVVKTKYSQFVIRNKDENEIGNLQITATDISKDIYNLQ